MAERRSLGDAMGMSEEKMAFIHGQSTKEAKTPAIAIVPGNKSDSETIVEIQSAKREEEKAGPSRSSRRATKGRASIQSPEASEILAELLVPVTIRLQHRTAQALRRANLEQRITHSKPDTQQEIVEQAIVEWLLEHGFAV